MTLPLTPPLKPMLAKLARTLPEGDGWLFEPKWDGFRCIVFRDGDDIELASRNERPFTRYFPELLDPLRATLPAALRRRRRDRRARPAPGAGSTSTLCTSASTRPSPVSGGWPPKPRPRTSPSICSPTTTPSLLDRPLHERRAALLAAVHAAPAGPPHAGHHRRPPSPPTGSPASRAPGSTASSPSGSTIPTQQDKRALVKVKHERTADCVVAGYRIHKDGQGVGSLLLGLYDDERPAAARRRGGRRSRWRSAASCSTSSSR